MRETSVKKRNRSDDTRYINRRDRKNECRLERGAKYMPAAERSRDCAQKERGKKSKRTKL